MKLAVVTPWASPFIWSKFALNVGQMLAAFRRPGWETTFFTAQGVDPAARHVNVCTQSLDWGADLMCIIGADQIHPVDMLDRLVDRYEETGGGVISALVPFRGYVAWQEMRPFQPMGWRLRCEGVQTFENSDTTPDLFEAIDPAAGDLQRVDIIGTGVLLLHTDYLRALKPPWFYYRVNPETMQRVADMDTQFVWRLRAEVQADVWVDTTINVRHLHTFEIDETYQDRFADWATTESHEDICQYRSVMSERIEVA